jgi:hypothetical protein
MKVKVAAGLLGVGVLAVGGFALNQTGGSTNPSAAITSQGGPAGAGFRGGPGGGGAPVSGSISAVSATSISVKTTGGTTTYKIASGTVVQNNGATSTVGKLAVGEKVVVFTGAAPGANRSTTSTDTASRILAGSSATRGPGAGAPPNAAGAGSASNPGATSATTT